MEYSGNKKLKVVWICHFTNKEIQSMLPIWKKTKEFGPWIPNTIKGFENIDDIELHIISPHDYLKRMVNVKLRNVNYWFIPFGIPFWNRHWPDIFRFDVFVNYFFLINKIAKKVRMIGPDIVNLQGAENAYYSSSVLNLKNKYPILITIQGFVSLELEGDHIKEKNMPSRINTELQILKKFKYFSGDEDSKKIISTYNNDFIFFKQFYPVNEALINQTNNIEKKYDLLFYGRMSKGKGIEDFIKIISKLKLRKKNIKACVIGPCRSVMMKSIKVMAEDMGCLSNIEFVGFVETQAELFTYVKASKVFLVPTYNDRLPSTIREAMWLKVSVVSYATGSIPFINRHQENIFLVEQGDRNGMAEKAYSLLQQPDLRMEMEERALLFAKDEFSLKNNTKKLIGAYRSIIDNERTKK